MTDTNIDVFSLVRHVRTKGSIIYHIYIVKKLEQPVADCRTCKTARDVKMVIDFRLAEVNDYIDVDDLRNGILLQKPIFIEKSHNAQWGNCLRPRSMRPQAKGHWMFGNCAIPSTPFSTDFVTGHVYNLVDLTKCFKSTAPVSEHSYQTASWYGSIARTCWIYLSDVQAKHWILSHGSSLP